MSELETNYEGNTIDATPQETFIQTAQVAIDNYKTTKSEIDKAIEVILEIKENSPISETLRKIRENYSSRKNDYASADIALTNESTDALQGQPNSTEETYNVTTTCRKSIRRVTTFKVKKRSKTYLEENSNESEMLGIQGEGVLEENGNIPIREGLENVQPVAEKAPKRKLSDNANIGIAMMQFEPKGVRKTSDKTKEIVVTRYAKARENILAVIRGTGNNVLNKVSENLQTPENIEKTSNSEKDEIEK